MVGQEVVGHRINTIPRIHLLGSTGYQVQIKGIFTIIKTTNTQIEDGMGTKRDIRTQKDSEWESSESF